jgi:hypothetical protein
MRMVTIFLLTDPNDKEEAGAGAQKLAAASGSCLPGGAFHELFSARAPCTALLVRCA